jgi:hypothetical protein
MIISRINITAIRKYLQAISDHLNETEFRIRFLKLNGLCIPHIETPIQIDYNHEKLICYSMDDLNGTKKEKINNIYFDLIFLTIKTAISQTNIRMLYVK